MCGGFFMYGIVENINSRLVLEESNINRVWLDGQIYDCKNRNEKLKLCQTEPSLLAELDGNFAFAVWDSKKEELFLARDHFGTKPLYYSIFEGKLIFASEINAILDYPNFKTEVDEQGICELFGIGPAHTSRNLCV